MAECIQARGVSSGTSTPQQRTLETVSLAAGAGAVSVAAGAASGVAGGLIELSAAAASCEPSAPASPAAAVLGREATARGSGLDPGSREAAASPTETGPAPLTSTGMGRLANPAADTLLAASGAATGPPAPAGRMNALDAANSL